MRNSARTKRILLSANGSVAQSGSDPKSLSLSERVEKSIRWLCQWGSVLYRKLLCEFCVGNNWRIMGMDERIIGEM